MKALIRNKFETVLETDGIPGIDWNTGAPLTSSNWVGGPYRLIQNYVSPQENEPESYEEVEVAPQAESEPEIENEDDYVIIDGKKYSKAKLRSLLE